MDQQNFDVQLKKLEDILDAASNNNHTLTVKTAMKTIWHIMDSAEEKFHLTTEQAAAMLSLATSFVATIHIGSLLDAGEINLEEAERLAGGEFCYEA